MTAVAKAPRINADLRQHWASRVLATCLLHAVLLRIIERQKPGDTDLQVLPPSIHEVVFSKCQELIERACRAEVGGHDRIAIERKANGELWDFLKAWRRDGA